METYLEISIPGFLMCCVAALCVLVDCLHGELGQVKMPEVMCQAIVTTKLVRLRSPSSQSQDKLSFPFKVLTFKGILLDLHSVY